MEGSEVPSWDAATAGVEVVVTHQVLGTHLVTPHAGGDPLDLGWEGPLPRDVVDVLRGSSLLLQAGGDVPQAVIEELWEWPVPLLFRGSPWLRRARALVLIDGRTEVAGAGIGYLAGLGLWVDVNTTDETG
ncbi:hypothetical protein ACIOGX_15050 [Streptomyces sp. NPDC088147]|uniref:hypothetical protein n=1 Tax=Streptomyces sp. NPDC088147 TaxID=3365830 RepID=UPI0037F6F6AA